MAFIRLVLLIEFLLTSGDCQDVQYMSCYDATRPCLVTGGWTV